MINTRHTWCAGLLAALMLVGLAGPASASTIYDFTFGSAASGFFVTAGAAADPGFELITSITLDFVTTTDSVVHTGPFTSLFLAPGAAYNPTTGAFLNHFLGNTYDDFGGTFLTGTGGSGSVSLNPNTFSKFGELDGEFGGPSSDGVLQFGPLDVAAGVPSDPPVIPEPASLLLLGTGLLGATAVRRRRPRTI